MPFEYPIWLDDLLQALGATLIPIALVLGRLPASTQPCAGQGRLRSTVGLAFKLAIGPALILLTIRGPAAGCDWRGAAA